MAVTKLQSRSLVQQLLDDSAAAFWTAPNLDLLIEGTIDELYGELLETFPWLQTTETSAAIVAPGYVNLAALTRYHRLQQVVRNEQTYMPADPKDVLIVNGQVVSAPTSSYIVLGQQLHLFPYDTTTPVYVRYSSLPTAFSSLADGTAVDWPDGHHLAFIYEAAARAMEKGDRENSDRFSQRAQVALLRLRSRLRKQQVGPVMPWHADDARYWGGQ